jgi:23S rRNA (cytidine1920-2'-O)/16S rRNA (cytidine1409-2'-O)-methyltransferase
VSKGKERLDKLLVERGLAPTRSKGQALVMAGEVLVDGQPALKPGMTVPVSSNITLVESMPYVSRGGYKLAEALAKFAIDVGGRICADVGACTGGFTDVLLQQGAQRVYAIDVGYGQLDWNLRQDPRVVVLERTNARHLETLPEPVQLVVIDVSFISLKLVIPAVQQWLADEADVVALIKPQFEAGREKVGKGGIVRDPSVHHQVLTDLLVWMAARQLLPKGLIRSPIEGAGGNVEFLVWLQPGSGEALDVAAVVNGLLKV